MMRFYKMCAAACLVAFSFAALAQEGQPATPVPLPQVGPSQAERPMRSGGPEVPMPEIHIHDAWVRPAAMGGTTGLYMQIDNLTLGDFNLTAVVVDFSAMVEIHQTMMEGDIMRMRPLEGGVPVPAGERALLEPGAMHVMLMGVNRDLTTGEVVRFTATLTPAEAGAEPITQEVLAYVADEPPPENFFYVVDAFAQPVTAATDQVVSALEAPEVATAVPPIEAIGVYGTIVNWGAPTVNVVRAEAAFAEAGEVRESYILEGNIAYRTAEYLPAPIGARLVMRPNNLFAFLGTLTEAAPSIGDLFVAELVFEDGARLLVPLELRAAEEEN